MSGPAQDSKPLELAPARACGACSACCYIPGVDELNKAPYVACEHSSIRGCAIYGEHPAPCRGYRCMWIDGGIGGEESRPDRLGLMFDLPDDVARHPHYRGVPVVCARELWDGAREGAGAMLLASLSRTMVVRLYLHGAVGERAKLMGPKRLIDKLQRRAEAQD